MRALEFLARVGSDTTSLELPAEVAAKLPAGRPVRVLILVEDEADEAEEEAAWKRMAVEQLFKGEEDFDGLYDQP